MTEKKVCNLCAAGPCVWYLARTQCDPNGTPLTNPATGKPDYVVPGESIMFDPEAICPDYPEISTPK